MKTFPTQLITPQAVIKEALLDGARLTTAQGNRLAGTVDFRKIIARLRAEGFEVKDFWMQEGSRRWKYYFHEKPLAAKGSKLANVLQTKMELN